MIPESHLHDIASNALKNYYSDDPDSEKAGYRQAVARKIAPS